MAPCTLVQIGEYVVRAEQLKEILKSKRPSQRQEQPPVRLIGNECVCVGGGGGGGSMIYYNNQLAGTLLAYKYL